MLTCLNDILGYRINALDGQVGVVKDFYFDSVAWTVRYIVADTGNWLMGKAVLLSLASVAGVNRPLRELSVDLTRKQIEEAPTIESHREISRSFEKDLAAYYSWPAYWEQDTFGEALQLAPPAIRGHSWVGSTITAQEEHSGLRSLSELMGYHIVANDGRIGHLDRLVLNDDDWMVRYMVIETHNWVPGRKVLVAPEWVTGLDFIDKTMSLDLDRHTIKTAPAYDVDALNNPQYASALADLAGKAT